MRDLLRKLSRWDRTLLLLVGVYLLLWPAESLSAFVLETRVALQIAIYAIGSVVIMRFAIRGTKALIRRFLWRVRHRMIAVYLFVGVIPLALAITLAGLGLRLLFGPVAAYMVRSTLDQHAAALQSAASSFGWELRATVPARRREAAGRFISDASPRFPGIMLRVDTPRGPAGFPQWLVDDRPPDTLQQFQGVLRRSGKLYLAGHAQYSSDSPSVLLMMPLTAEYLARLLPGLGIVERMAPPGPLGERVASQRAGQGLLDGRADNAVADGRAGDGQLPPPLGPLDGPIRWSALIPVLSWESGESRLEAVFALRSRYSAVGRLLFSSQSMEVARGVQIASYVLAGLFCGAVVISLIVAVSLTRTMTGAVHELYLGTERVNHSDFSHRVAIRGDDQLTELGRSFNNMTESIERLIEESRERQRLQAELEIAREVQARLFPRELPRLKTLDVLGVCRPAQEVSGDFFDYVELSPTRLALAFGDVSGKGISAALVMASMHSIVRTQLSLLTGSNGELALSTAELVARANQQLYAGTAPDKFSTLFFGSYDEQESSLVYSNAGHLPPFLIRGGEVQRLDVSGLVVGAFPHAQYESSKIELTAGDLLVAYTDGVTEPENAYGEEFGEQRLIEALLRHADRPIDEIIQAVMQEVIEWTGETTLQDDMTMLVARRRS